MQRLLILIVALTCVAQFCFGANDSTIEDARKLLKEQSYALALQKADDLLSATEESVAREASYIRGVSLLYLGRRDEAKLALESVIQNDKDDIWSGRAHWHLQPGLPPQTFYFDYSSTQPLVHLREAERILSSEKSGDLKELYRQVLDSLINQYPPDETDRKYLYTFFDKLIAALTDTEEIAETHLKKAMYPRAEYMPAEERIRKLRTIVAECPSTKAAPQAQMLVAEDYINRNELVPALYELSVLSSKFAGSDEAKQALKLSAEIKQPQVTFHLPGPFLPGEPVKFIIATRNTSRITITATPFDPAKAVREQRTTQLDLQQIGGKPTLHQTVDVKQSDDHQATTRTVELRIDTPGAYALKAVAGNGGEAQCLLLISNLALLSNRNGKGMEFWVADAKTGKPRAGATVTIGSEVKTEKRWFNRQEKSYFSKFTNLTSNSDGFADFTGSADSNQIAAFASDGNQYAFLDNLYWNPYYSNQDAYPLFYIYTDRPVYRPKQKAYWRAIVRNHKEGSYTFDSRATYRVQIFNPQGATVLEQQNLKISEFGSLSGELDLPDGAPLGMYRLHLQDQANSQQGHDGQFRVEEYKKPEFEVEVNAGTDLVRLGGQVQARLEAKYYFGAPVADAEVKYTVRRRPKYRTYWDDYIGNSAAKELGWFDALPTRPDQLHGSSGDIVATGEARTDSTGNCVISFKADVPATLPPQQTGRYGREFQWGYWPPVNSNTYDFQIEATVTDKSRRNIDASQSIVVSDKALKLGVGTARRLVVPGDLVKVDAASLNWNDKPVATSATLYIERLRWNESTLKDDITTISTTRVDISSSGTAQSDWRVPVDEIGRMRLVLIAPDPFGGDNVAMSQFTIASDQTRDVHTRYQGVELVADKTVYDVGDTARLMIMSEFKDAVAWYWIDAGAGNLERRIVPLPDRTNFVHIPITDAFVPNCKIHVVSIKDQKVIQDDLELVVPPKRQVLSVEFAADKPEHKPGEEANIHLTAHDFQGKPVRAEFSVSFFDQAITYIAPDIRQDIRRTLYGQRRQLQSNLLDSFGTSTRYSVMLPADMQRFISGRDRFEGILGGFYDGDSRAEYKKNGRHDLPRSAGRMMANAPAAPPPAMAIAAAGAAIEMDAVAAPGQSSSDAGGSVERPLAAPVVRTDFRDSMFWSSSVVTDLQGNATVKVKFPDSLTTWRGVAVGTTANSLVGNVTTDTVVMKKLLARLEAPRFFRERDSVTISAVMHNYLPAAKEVTASLDATAELLIAAQSKENGLTRKLTIAAGGEARVDWDFKVSGSGTARLKLNALTDEESDAVQLEFPVLTHGMDKFVAWNGSTSDEKTTGVTTEKNGQITTLTQMINIPAERIKRTTKLTINLNPSLASSIRDAIPYMIEYPYGCVEQTMSRFLPAAVAASTFRNLNMPADPVLTERLPQVIASGVQRLKDFQHSDGGWGWWRDDQQSAHMTAYVMYGFTLVREADVAIDDDMFNRGLARLRALTEELTKAHEKRSGYWGYYDIHALMFAELVLTLNGQSHQPALDLLWQRRGELSAQGLAMLARTLWRAGRQDDARLVLRNMFNVVTISPENKTAHWESRQSGCYWWDDAVESTSHGLRAYLEIDPSNELVDQAMKWLVLNRQGRQWKSTRDTAQAVLALSAYMSQRKEGVGSMDITVQAGSMEPKVLHVTKENFWDFKGSITLEGDAVGDGETPVRISRTGNGTLFYSIFAEYFTLEEGIKNAGNEIYVERTYEKLVRDDSVATVGLAANDKYVPVKDDAVLTSGDELRVTLKIKSLNDYEYLIFEDPKPAGMEPVSLVSGSTYGGGLCSNMELRDQWVAFFITHLPQGEHTIQYNCRAEIPGIFHTMPTKGYAMYFPPLHTNSDEIVLRVVDK